MNNLFEKNSYWCLKLLSILQEMAAQQTNAVLMTLANVECLESECRYPDSGLLFAANQWRAFYHCHETTPVHSNEHGHFHIFTDTGDHAWAHVAGLSIDAEGQPLQWFMVNRWVTDGPWLERDGFFDQLEQIVADDEDDDLVGRWLAALLKLYSDELYSLLHKRDQQLHRRMADRCMMELLEDRELYTLATQAVDIQSMLEKQLLQNKPGTSGQACTHA